MKYIMKSGTQTFLTCCFHEKLTYDHLCVLAVASGWRVFLSCLVGLLLCDTHREALTARFGCGDRARQPRWTLDAGPLPDLHLSAGRLRQNPKHVVTVGAVHVVSKLDADLRGRRREGGTQQTSFLPVRHVVALVIDVVTICRERTHSCLSQHVFISKLKRWIMCFSDQSYGFRKLHHSNMSIPSF